jgi:hypothetical protein
MPNFSPLKKRLLAVIPVLSSGQLTSTSLLSRASCVRLFCDSIVFEQSTLAVRMSGLVAQVEY